MTGDVLLIGLALFLTAATFEDLLYKRISNVLTFGAAGVALVLNFVINDFHGLMNSLGGLGVGLAVFLPLFLLGGMGAGDVKMMAAAGAFLAPLPSLFAVALTLIAGAVLGIAVLAVRGDLVIFLKRWGPILLWVMSLGRLTYARAPDGTVTAQRFPYALAIAVGTLSAVYLLRSG